MAGEPQRFVLGIAYQAGPDPRIKRGVDGGRDWFSKEELERACWSYMRSGCPQINAFHVDGTEDCAEPVESFIWRWDDWDVGDGIVVKDGDWCLGAILSPRMWDLHKAGKVNAFSPEGTATRRRIQKEGAMQLAKGSAEAETADVDDEFTELVNANVPKMALVEHGANGIPRFLITKQDGAALLEPDFVRELIGKSAPAPADGSEPSTSEVVTMTGSPAALAEVMQRIHGAPVRKAQDVPAEVEKAQASTATMNDREDSDFAYIEPGGHKDDEGKTVPRSLRHFPIYDAAHVRDALSRAPQSPFGDKAMPKIRAAAKKFDIDVAKTEGDAPQDTEVTKDMAEMDGDAMDPAVLLAEPEGDDAPGNPAEPGSPAWEAVDAATARKWTAILARARAALELMSDRENLEAATADPDDAEAALDLDDAACAVDYAISILAPFAVDEQAEAECCDDETMGMIGKALGAFDVAPLEVIESLTGVRKSGRVLSASNEAAIRGAVESLQKVLASLPAAPTADTDGGQAVAKTANEEPEMPETTPSSETTEASGQQPAMGTATPDPQPVAGAAVTDVAKADSGDGKTPMVAVYDADGNLVGIVDPTEITPIQGAKKNDQASGAEGAEQDGDAAEAADAADLTPEPPAQAGTPADAAPAAGDGDTEEMTKALAATGGTPDSNTQALIKAALDEHSAGQAEIVKGLEEKNQALEERYAQLEKRLAESEERLTTVENQPAISAVFANGAVPPAHMLRGQDHGTPVALTKAQEMRAKFTGATDAVEAAKAADQMQAAAIDAFTAMRQR